MASSKVYGGEYHSAMKNKYQENMKKRDGLFEQEQRNAHLSPLQKLQIKYQQKLMQEKQQKMMSVYEKARDRSLENIFQKSSKEVQKYFPTGASPSATRDRSTKQMSVLKANDNHTLNNQTNQYKTPTKRPNTLPPIHTKYNNNNHQNTLEESPPPNPGQLRYLHRKQKERWYKTSSAGRHRTAVDPIPLSDYQKFKLEQDIKREERLRLYQLEKMRLEDKNKSTYSRPPHQERQAKKPTQYAGDSSENSEVIPRRSPTPPPVKTRSKKLNNNKDGRHTEQNKEIQRLLEELERKKKELLVIQKENEKYDETSDTENFNGGHENLDDFNAFRQKPVLVRRDRSSNVSRASSSSANINHHKTKHFDNEVSHKPSPQPKQISEPNMAIQSSGKNKTKHGFGMKTKQQSAPAYEERQKPSNRPHNIPNDQAIGLPKKWTSKKQKKHMKSPVDHLHGNNFNNQPTTNEFYSASAVNKQQVLGGEVISEQPEEIVKMVECHMCNRKFNEQRIQKHYAICSKTHNKERKQFDMTKVRTAGTELETYNSSTTKKYKQPLPKQVKKANWRDKHNEFIQTIREAKQFQQHIANGGKASDLPPPVASKNEDYVQCPHCSRRYNSTVAERHIPKCKDIKAKPTFLKKRSRK